MSRFVLKRLFGTSPDKEATAAAYNAAVEQARHTRFYEEYGVPDTVDGRFEMILLHVFFILHRIRGEAAAQEFGQSLFDLLFADMDRSLREMGVGDLSVGREIKHMATGFYGRISIYEKGLDGETDLNEGLRRNLYATAGGVRVEQMAAMSTYITGQTHFLRSIALNEIIKGQLKFLPPSPLTARQ